MNVSDVMTKALVTVRSDAHLREAAALNGPYTQAAHFSNPFL
jgi:hypothetical protein